MNFKKYLVSILNRLTSRDRLSDILSFSEQSATVLKELYLIELLKHERYTDTRRLAHYENQIYSRHGCDGIIAEIIKRVGISNKIFVEIGCGNGLENNTTNLLLSNWSGFWFDGDNNNIDFIQHHFQNPIQNNLLKVQQAFFTTENIIELFEAVHVPKEFDLLSIDIDRNTYYIWEKLDEYRPRIVVIEYNSKILPNCDWRVSYNSHKIWNSTNYMGASLKALEILGQKLGYYLVGCDLAGTDAFFIRNDIDKSSFVAPFTSENHYEPPRYYLLRKSGHRNCFID